MNELNTEGKSTARINCRIEGSAVDALAYLKRRGIVRNNREAVVQALIALEEKIVKSDLEKSARDLMLRVPSNPTGKRRKTKHA